MDAKMRNLPCTRLEMDEIWGFVGKKEKHVQQEDDPALGSVWTFCAIDADTKLVPAFSVGERERPRQTPLCGRSEPDDGLECRFQRMASGPT